MDEIATVSGTITKHGFMGFAIDNIPIESGNFVYYFILREAVRLKTIMTIVGVYNGNTIRLGKFI